MFAQMEKKIKIVIQTKGYKYIAGEYPFEIFRPTGSVFFRKKEELFEYLQTNDLVRKEWKLFEEMLFWEKGFPFRS